MKSFAVWYSCVSLLVFGTQAWAGGSTPPPPPHQNPPQQKPPQQKPPQQKPPQQKPPQPCPNQGGCPNQQQNPGQQNPGQQNPVQQNPKTPNFVAHWDMNESSWSKQQSCVKDSGPSKSFNGMPFNGAQIADCTALGGDEVCNAGWFPPLAYVQVDTNPTALSVQQYPEGWTMGAWVKVRTDAEGKMAYGWHTLFYKGIMDATYEANTNGSGYQREWILEVFGGTLDLTIWQNGGSNYLVHEFELSSVWWADTFATCYSGNGYKSTPCWHFIAMSVADECEDPTPPNPNQKKPGQQNQGGVTGRHGCTTDPRTLVRFYSIRETDGSEYYTRQYGTKLSRNPASASPSPLYLGMSGVQQNGLDGMMRGAFIAKGVLSPEQLRAEASRTFPGGIGEFQIRTKNGSNW